MYINTTGQIDTHTKIVLSKAKWYKKNQSINTQVVGLVWGKIKSWLPSLTWLLPWPPGCNNYSTNF
jgi:hypothetical protein